MKNLIIVAAGKAPKTYRKVTEPFFPHEYRLLQKILGEYVSSGKRICLEVQRVHEEDLDFPFRGKIYVHQDDSIPISPPRLHDRLKVKMDIERMPTDFNFPGASSNANSHLR